MAPKNKSKSNKNKELDKNIPILDLAAQKLLSTIDNSYIERELLSKKDSKIHDILNAELELAKGISGGSIVDFVTGIQQKSAEQAGKDPKEIDSYSLFTEDIGNIFGYFQELYKNRYIELADLKFITKFIPGIGEAIKTTLDSIVGSDDFSEAITRNIVLNSGLTNIEKSLITTEINRIEKDEKLLKKLKNIVYKKALISGSHYIYCVPYKELFEEYDRLSKSGKLTDRMIVDNGNMVNKRNNPDKKNKNNPSGFNLNYTMESTHLYDSGIIQESWNIDTVMENLSYDLGDIKESEKKEIRSRLESSLSIIETSDSEVLMEALEGFESSTIMKNNLSRYRDMFKGNAILAEDPKFSEGTYGTNGNMSGKPSKFNTLGSYIKYIDVSKIIPIRVYNQVIGYFHVHDTTVKKKASSMNRASETNLITSTANIFSSQTLAENSREKAVSNIINTITDGILQNFSNKFVNKNQDFKKIIGDCIVANGLINSSFQIQFIPANHIIAFSVNENEDGVGTSTIQDSLFPAKMLLSTIVSKLLMYMNNAGNKTIAYVRKGPIDVSSSNHVQRVIRMLQESRITFSDLLSTNLSFAKFSRNGNIQLPMAKNGDRLIDFETQEGQEVDMRTPMEEYLEKLAIMGTGVPSVIMDYTDAADYAKSLDSANIKFAGRVASLQADLEEATTELYLKLIETSNLDEDIKKKAIADFSFKLCRPRVLTNTNMSDYLSQMQSIADILATVVFGSEVDESDPHAIATKQHFIKNVFVKYLPFLDMDDLMKMANDARIAAIADKPVESGSEGSDTGGDTDTGGDDEF